MGGLLKLLLQVVAPVLIAKGADAAGKLVAKVTKPKA